MDSKFVLFFSFDHNNNKKLMCDRQRNTALVTVFVKGKQITTQKEWDQVVLASKEMLAKMVA